MREPPTTERVRVEFSYWRAPPRPTRASTVEASEATIVGDWPSSGGTLTPIFGELLPRFWGHCSPFLGNIPWIRESWPDGDTGCLARPERPGSRIIPQKVGASGGHMSGRCRNAVALVAPPVRRLNHMEKVETSISPMSRQSTRRCTASPHAASCAIISRLMRYHSACDPSRGRRPCSRIVL